MGKLHELLAVEPELRAAAQRELQRVKAMFESGSGRFIGRSRKYIPLVEDTTAQLPPEFTNLASNVEAELGVMGEAFAKWVDAVVEKEVTNTSAEARGSVVIDGKALFESLPATALLALEQRVAELRKVYAAIPTLDPTEEWNRDDSTGTYRSGVRLQNRDEKVRRSHVLYEATPEHPAQVESYSEPRVVGKWETIIFSGELEITDRRGRLERLDKLVRAIKEARMRANCAEVLGDHVGQKILDYINEG